MAVFDGCGGDAIRSLVRRFEVTILTPFFLNEFLFFFFFFNKCQTFEGFRTVAAEGVCVASGFCLEIEPCSDTKLIKIRSEKGEEEGNLGGIGKSKEENGGKSTSCS